MDRKASMTDGSDGQSERAPATGSGAGDAMPGSELRVWLQTQRHARRRFMDVGDRELRRGARLICVDARQRGIPVERMIIAVKNHWMSLRDDTEWQSTRIRDDSDHLERLISVLIEEFYRD
jgi:hypothetical protein